MVGIIVEVNAKIGVRVFFFGGFWWPLLLITHYKWLSMVTSYYRCTYFINFSHQAYTVGDYSLLICPHRWRWPFNWIKAGLLTFLLSSNHLLFFASFSWTVSDVAILLSLSPSSRPVLSTRLCRPEGRRGLRCGRAFPLCSIYFSSSCLIFFAQLGV